MITADSNGGSSGNAGKKEFSLGLWPGRPHSGPRVVAEVQLSLLVELETSGTGLARQGGLWRHVLGERSI